MNSAGGCRQEYYEQAGSYEQGRRMQARILRIGRKLVTGQVHAGKNTVDRQEVNKRAGGSRQEYYGQAGSYGQGR